MIKYEILTVAEEGVLPVITLFHQYLKWNKGVDMYDKSYQVESKYYTEYAVGMYEILNLDESFKDKEEQHWYNYYSALTMLALEHDLIIYEHTFGIYVIHNDIAYDPYELNMFEKALRPLKLDSIEARDARKKGLAKTFDMYNGKKRIITDARSKYVRPLKKDHSHVVMWEKRMYERIRLREGRKKGGSMYA